MAESNIPRMHVVDYVILALMLIISAGIGIYYALTGGKQRTSREYFMADRNLHYVPVSFSLMASYMSAITMLGVPADVYFNGTMWWWFAVAHVCASWIVAHTFIPIFFNLRLTSVNEYLELRFGKSLRFCGTVIFYIQKLLYLGVVIYAPCLALATITQFDLVTSVFLVGIVCTFYTTIGGMKAVVWTDTFQMLIAFVGFLAIVIKGSTLMGWQSIWQINQEGQRIDFFTIDPDPRVRHTLWSVIIGGTFQWTFAYGINQWQIQRYLTCRSLTEARRAIAIFATGLVVATTLTTMCGMIAYAYYHGCDPYTLGNFKRTDQLLPYLVLDIFQDVPGLTGIFMAAIFSAALSTMSSALNSLATITGEDVIKRIRPDISDRIYTIINKFVALFFGCLVIGLAFVISKIGKVSQTVITFGGALGGPLMGVFFLGIFFPRASTKETWVGFFTGYALSLWICLGSLLNPPVYERLPLYIDSCEYNDTITMSPIIEHYTSAFEMNQQANYTVEGVKRSGLLGFYSVSYIWFALIASTSTVIVALLCTLITGGNPPGTVDPRLYCPLSNVLCSCVPNKYREKMGCPNTFQEDVDDDDDYKYVPTEEKLSKVNDYKSNEPESVV